MCLLLQYLFNTETWESLVKGLPPAMTEGINLSQLLSKEGSLSSFCGMSERAQNLILCSVLGEESPLIQLIMEGTKVRAGTALLLH